MPSRQDEDRDEEDSSHKRNECHRFLSPLSLSLYGSFALYFEVVKRERLDKEGGGGTTIAAPAFKHGSKVEQNYGVRGKNGKRKRKNGDDTVDVHAERRVDSRELKL